MSEWYDGPYKVLDGVDQMARRPRPGRGDIIAHRSGALVLRCPACNALQFTRGTVFNAKESPTIDRPIHCGSGHCQKCGVWFSIKNGRALPAKAPEKTKLKIPEKLARAGVHEAPPRPEPES